MMIKIPVHKFSNNYISSTAHYGIQHISLGKKVQLPMTNDGKILAQVSNQILIDTLLAFNNRNNFILMSRDIVSYIFF